MQRKTALGVSSVLLEFLSIDGIVVPVVPISKLFFTGYLFKFVPR
jgi:hypothetical protein